jgi:tetratricopeptide (TPR) repeat protein
MVINISSLIASDLKLLPPLTTTNHQKLFEGLFNGEGFLIYDHVTDLLDKIERGELEDLTKEDFNKLTNFVTYLAKEGTLPNAQDEEKALLKRDIEELLNELGIEKSFSPETQIFPAIYDGQGGEILLCKSWIKKQLHHIAKFVKKHKKAVIIGAVVVVAAVAVVATLVVASSTAAATAATAAVINNGSVKEASEIKETPSKPSAIVDEKAPSQLFEQEISSYQQTLTEMPSLDRDFSTDRTLGSLLAHDSLSKLPNTFSMEDYDKFLLQGHSKIDLAFATEQTPSFLTTENRSIYSAYYQFQGEQALDEISYDQAINSFTRSMEINPENSSVYLDRAYAYLESGNFDNSLKDYNHYTEQTVDAKKSNLGSCLDFSLGVTSGLSKGAFYSGKELLTFATQALTHPINTGYGIYDSFSHLAELASSQKWEEFGQTLAPEVADLVRQWDNLTPKEKGERAGYIFGKYGADILLPGVGAKALAEGVKGAKEIAQITKNLQNTEKMIALEALADTGGCSGSFAEAVTSWKEAGLMPASELLRHIERFPVIQTPEYFLNILKPEGRLISNGNGSVRLFLGNENEARQVFNLITQQGTIVYSDSKRIVSQITNDFYVTYRPLSTTGPPTIDVNLPGRERNIKLKFLEKQ